MFFQKRRSSCQTTATTHGDGGSRDSSYNNTVGGETQTDTSGVHFWVPLHLEELCRLHQIDERTTSWFIAEIPVVQRAVIERGGFGDAWRQRAANPSTALFHCLNSVTRKARRKVATGQQEVSAKQWQELLRQQRNDEANERSETNSRPVSSADGCLTPLAPTS